MVELELLYRYILLLLFFFVNFIHFPNPKFLEIRRASFRRAAPSSPSPVPTNTPYWRSKSASPCETLIKSTSKRCEKQQQGERREGCQKLCQQEYDRGRETYKERERQHRGGGGSSEYHDCRRECQQGRRGDKEDCKERCDRRHGRHGGGNRREWEETREGSNSSPYVFEDRHFVTGIKSQHGRLRILQKFTERSELLRGIENFRVGIFEAQPQTFVVPNHWDADTLIFVANGRGTVSFVRQEKRESFSIKEGDIFRIRAGTTSYLINRDNNERLVLVKLYQPVNTPGEFERALLVPAMEGRGIIGRAKNGTGKTLAFGIPMIKALEDLEQGRDSLRRGQLPKVLIL